MSPAMRDGIVKRGSRWAFKLELPPDPATGKRRQKWVSGFRTRKEAQAARDDARARLRVGAYLAPSRETVGDYLTTWLAGVRGEYAPGAFDAARLHVERYIIPRIGAVRLAELTMPMVKAFCADVAETGRVRGDQPLSAKTVHNVHRTLSRALNDAVAELPPRILVNPAARAHKVPPSPEQPRWTAEQLRRFYLHIEDDRLFALWRLAATTGLRRGELAGLRWVDVDLDAGHLTLRVQRAKGGGSVVERQLKGKRGRLVSLDPATAAALRAHRTGQLEERMRWGPAWVDTGRVFTHPDGSELHPDSITKQLKRLVDDAGLPWIKLHGLRHTHATLMLEAGVHIKIVQERLGHSSIAITGDVYSHVTPGLQQQAAERAARLVDGES